MDPPPAQVCAQAERRGALQQGVTETRGMPAGPLAGPQAGLLTTVLGDGCGGGPLTGRGHPVRPEASGFLTQQSVFLRGGQGHRLTQCLQDTGQSDGEPPMEAGRGPSQLGVAPSDPTVGLILPPPEGG